MRIIQTAWSEKRKNHLINFYALEPDNKGRVEILNPQFSWDSNNDALSQINAGRISAGIVPYHGSILHVVLDMSSGRLYLPNKEGKEGINSDPRLLAMYDAIRLKIEKLIDFLPMAPPINGDPFDVLRIRRIGDFHSVADFIKRQSKNVKQFEKELNVPVIEANLSLMPETVKAVFGEGSQEVKNQWAFVGGNKIINFVMKERTDAGIKEMTVHQQKAPFILLNTAPEAKVSNADKERLVVTAYREYASVDRTDDPMSRESPLMQSFRYLMYIGWSFKELCLFMLRDQEVTDLRSFAQRGAFLFNAAKSLKTDGYPDPSANPYYYSFKIDKDFPINFHPQIGVDVYDYSNQQEIFRIVFFDPQSSYITIKTPLFISDSVLKKIFLPKSPIFVAQYDTTDKAIRTNVAVSGISLASKRSLNAVKKDVSSVFGQPETATGIQERFLTDMRFERKHISDYPQATEIIKDLCEQLSVSPDKEASASPGTIKFDDLEVVVGPWQETEGFLGGYWNERRTNEKSKTGFIEPVPGLKVYPPFIMIDNKECPSVGDRTHVIIHEYRHHINAQLWIKSPSYDVSQTPGEAQKDRVDKMVKYLKSPDERIAHKTQFKYMLAIGMSREQILRQVLHGKPTINNIPVVKEYLGIIVDASRELDSERRNREISAKMTEDIQKREDELSNVDINFFDPDEPLDI